MPRKSQRSKLRASRYQQLRSLGYSSADATRLRDRSSESIDKDIAKRQRRISRKRVANRTLDEKIQLSRIRTFRRLESASPTTAREPFESDNTKQENFSRWSKEKAFPAAIQRYINGLNRQAGLDNPFASYGYRVFYHQYVNGYTERQAKMHVRTLDRERRDT